MEVIDDVDDNEGMKEFMELWNLHVMEHGIVRDYHIPLGCDMFVELKGHEILQKNLYRNFLLHMCMLSDYGLVSPEFLYTTVLKLQQMM